MAVQTQKYDSNNKLSPASAIRPRKAEKKKLCTENKQSRNYANWSKPENVFYQQENTS